MAIDPAELIEAPGSNDRLRSSLERETISSLQLGPAITVPEEASLKEAVENLQKHHIGCVLVSGADGTLKGIFTERDLLNRVAGRGLDWSRCRVADFMTYFEERYRFKSLGTAGRILAIGAAHHRFNYIHPFPDGNGRVSRLMSHAMAHSAGIGAHGLWSISQSAKGPVSLCFPADTLEILFPKLFPEI